VRVPKQVDARLLGRAEGKAPLAVAPPWTGRGELDEIGNGACASLLGHPDQPQQDLGGRLGVGEGAVAGTRLGDEAMRQSTEIRRLTAEEPAGEPDRVDDRRGDPVAGQAHRLVVEEGHVEPRVVRDEDGVAAELEKASNARSDRWRAAELGVAQPGQRRDRGLQRRAGVGERLEALRQLEPAHPHGADLAWA